MARIVTVYRMWQGYRRFKPVDMSHILWVKISEALARLGYQVDIATVAPRWFARRTQLVMAPSLRRVPLTRVRWDECDVVKTLFGQGFQTLEHYGGDEHPFIISKLGSVVATRYGGHLFYGEQRKRRYAVQERIQRRSRFIPC